VPEKRRLIPMQLQVEKSPLLNILQNLISIVPTKTTLQVLSNFRVSLKGNELSISATDLDTSMQTTIEVKGSRDGEFAVNARKLFEIVRELPEAGVSLEAVNNILEITSDKGFTCKIAGSDTGDYPKPPSVDSALEFSAQSSLLGKMIEKTTFAVSTDENRQSLNGILWDIRIKEMRMVATDGHRLGYCTFKHSAAISEEKKIILSPKAMNHLCRLLGENTVKEVGVTVGSSYVIFKAGGSTLTSKLVDGPYPNYDQVIPKVNNKRAIADKSELIAAIRRVSVLSSLKTHQIKFLFDKDSLELSSINRDLGGEAKEKIAVSYTADQLPIGFNATFFQEILKLVDSQKVRLSLNSSISACLFHPESEEKIEEDYFFLLMPLRLLDEK
jgi:DNA polymerase-3 subunit beta